MMPIVDSGEVLCAATNTEDEVSNQWSPRKLAGPIANTEDFLRMQEAPSALEKPLAGFSH